MPTLHHFPLDDETLKSRPRTVELGGNGSKRTSAYVDELETGRGTGRLMPKKPEWMDAGKAGTRLRIYLAHLDSTLSSKTKWAMCEFK